jgi:hypothetical protein
MSSEHAALPEPTTDHGIDRRADQRFPCMAKATCRWRPAGESEVVIVNLSASGARLMVRTQEEPPTLAGIVFRGRSGLVVELGAREVYARREDDGWVLGCALGRRLSAAELRDLLPKSGGGSGLG